MRELTPNVFAVGAIDWDRRLFDELIPLPDGTTYNSYLIKGSEKTALLDTVDPTKKDMLIDNLIAAGTDKIDYIIAHHGEQDHSGCIGDILMFHPEAKVVTNPMCKGMLIDLLGLEDGQFITIDDGDKLSLGDKTLQFIYTPWVHWPETMSTYLVEDKIFFSCDFFGSHLACSDLFASDEHLVLESAKRYYAEIMMPFRLPIRKNLKKMKDLSIDMIAPSHGPVYQDPKFIIDAYKGWVSDGVKNEVVIAYISMHDSTRRMVDHFVSLLTERGITVKQFNLTVTDIGELAMSLVDAATLVIGSPTMLARAHPKVAYAAILANALKPKIKFVSVIGSYGWGGVMVKHLTDLISNLKVEIIEPVMAKGYPNDDDFKALDRLADEILNKHKSLKIA